MDNCLNLIRVRIDVSEMDLPFVKQAYVSVDRSILRTVKDFKNTLYRKFGLSGERNINLYLQKCLLLEEETVFILRDEDIIRVTYEDLPLQHRNSSVECNGCEDSMPSVLKGCKRCCNDENTGTVAPVRKKSRALSPIFPVLHCQPSETQISRDVIKTDCEFVYIPVERETNVHKDKSELIRKKHKKHKKIMKKEKLPNENISTFYKQNNLESKALTNLVSCAGSAKTVKSSTGRSIHPLKCTSKEMDHFSFVGGQVNDSCNISQNQVTVHEMEGTDEESCSRVTKEENLIKCVKKTSTPRMQESALRSPAEVNSSGIFSQNFINFPGDKTKSHNSPLSSESVQQQEAKIDICSTLTSTEIGQQTNGKMVEMKISDAVDIPLQEHLQNPGTLENNLSIRLESDCTQALGNNCPKKKRRRKRKKSTRASLDVKSSVPEFPQSLASKASSVIFLGKSNDRKHIKFADSPQRDESPVGSPLISDTEDNTALGSQYPSVQQSSVEELCETKESIKKQLSPAPFHEEKQMTLTQKLTDIPDEYFPYDSLDSLEMESQSHSISGPLVVCQAEEMVHKAKSSLEKQVSSILVHQENTRHFSERGDGTYIPNNDSAGAKHELQPSDIKSYTKFPPLTKFPSVGDTIAYKVLELGDSYCPEVSDYKGGRIVNIDTTTDILEIELLEEQVIARVGKFENLYPGDSPELKIVKKVSVNWTSLLEPRLISSCT